jgi:2-oxoisovalerate dehydrogenase E1 component beta subunit
MKPKTMVQAICDALKVALETDPRVILLGEDIGKNGGVFRATEGLWELFGEERVMDTPLAEAGIIGSSIGLAVGGFRPVAEVQFMGFIYPAMEQLVTHAARLRTRTQGRYPASMVVRVPYGGGIRAPELHSDSTESLFVHIPGLKVLAAFNSERRQRAFACRHSRSGSGFVFGTDAVVPFGERRSSRRVV